MSVASNFWRMSRSHARVRRHVRHANMQAVGVGASNLHDWPLVRGGGRDQGAGAVSLSKSGELKGCEGCIDPVKRKFK